MIAASAGIGSLSALVGVYHVLLAHLDHFDPEVPAQALDVFLAAFKAAL